MLRLLCLMPLFSALTVSGCETVPRQQGLSLSQLDNDPKILTFALPETPHGRMVIDAGLHNGRTVRLMLDTGATQSALYASEWKKLGLAVSGQKRIRIHGMLAADVQPVVTVPTLNLGDAVLQNIPIARLDDPDPMARERELHDGILGMDIMSNYHLYVDRPDGIIKFIPVDLGPLSVPPSWRIVTLKPNPFIEDGRQLHFMDVRLGNSLTPSLLDTGSEFNLMNWNVSRFPQLRAVRSRMLKNWKIQGAVGTFKPVSKVHATDYRAGQKVFSSTDFIVLDFDSLEVLGIEDKPFLIIGAKALMNERYMIDFKRDILVFAPTNEEKIYRSRGAMPTFTRRTRK